jgi:RNA polymerase sigma-70 factor (ECF subfamily)
MIATACYFVNWMEQENTEIARGLRRQDPDLLDRLIEQYQHRLLRYLLYLTGNRETAEDLFQETWIRVLERGSQYDGKHNFSTWLFAVARNLSIDQLRRKKTVSLDSMAGEDEAPPEIADTAQVSAFEVVARQELSEKVQAGLIAIQPEYRETVVLRFHEGLSLDEIAEVTGAPLGTIKSRLYRGLNALLPKLKGARE